MIQFSAQGAYNIDRIAFTDKKSELYLWIKIKRIDNAWVKIGKRVGAKAQDEKCVETRRKQKMGVISHVQNSQLLTCSLPSEEIFRV